jgi:glycolate oxidase
MGGRPRRAGIDVLGAGGFGGHARRRHEVTLKSCAWRDREDGLGIESTEAAGSAVSEIIGHHSCCRRDDGQADRGAEAAVHPNFPKAEAVLIVELDGAQSEVEGLFQMVEAICHRTGGTEVQIARNNDERARIWKGRKAAFAAMGRVSPNYYVQDGVIPRTKLPEVLGRIRALEERSGLRIGNVFHAGDGNLHPLICYDEQVPGQGELAEKVASEILMYCIEAGGSITGEHGVGADKSTSMAKMFSEADLDTMQLLRCAFDPGSICNPGKVFPPRMCGKVPLWPYRQHPAEKAGCAGRM